MFSYLSVTQKKTDKKPNEKVYGLTILKNIDFLFYCNSNKNNRRDLKILPNT